jgi:Outer membrane protein beta-barrel domain
VQPARNATRLAWLVLATSLVSASPAGAQSFDLGLHIVGARWSEFDGTDLGIGGRLSWNAAPVIGVEAEVNWYPREFPGDGIAFSGDRVEAIMALTAGPRLGRVRPFVRAGAGFLKSSGAPEPFACIAIFPPPLSCLLAAGDTMPAFDIGGGLEVSTSQTTFLRFDARDRILKYPGPTFGPAGEVRNDGFFGHAFRFSLGGGLRF